MTAITWILLSATSLSAAPDGMLLNFTASWCGPCRQMSPIVSNLQRQGYPVRKVDVDQNPELAQKYGVTSIPAFVLIVNGQPVNKIVGMTSEHQLRRMLTQIPERSAEMADTTPSPSSIARSRVAAERTAAQQKQARNASDSSSEERRRTMSETPEWSSATTASSTDSSSSHSSRESNSETSTKPRRGISLPFFGSRNREEPSTTTANTDSDANAPSEPVVRAKIDAQEPSHPGQVGSPLAASTRIRIRDKSGINFGSGTVVFSQPGQTLVVTCGHIFRNLPKEARIEVDVFSSGTPETYIGKVVRYDLEADVGLISIPTDSPLPACRIGSVESAVVRGQQVLSIGCGGGELPSKMPARVTALNRYLGPDNIECTGVPIQGRSGGGLFNADGEVVGVCIAADPRDQRGLYAGLKAVHKLLDSAQLTHLYRTNSAPGTTADSESQFARNNPSSRPSRNSAPSSGNRTTQPAFEADDFSHQTTPSRNNPVQLASRTVSNDSEQSGTDSFAPFETLDEIPSSELRAAQNVLNQAGEAEVVCIIRPLDDSRAASRVVIINRASSKFVAYLTDEIADQAQPTVKSVPFDGEFEDIDSMAASMEAEDGFTPVGSSQDAAPNTPENRPTHRAVLRAASTDGLGNPSHRSETGSNHSSRQRSRQAGFDVEPIAEPSQSPEPQRYRRSSATRAAKPLSP